VQNVRDRHAAARLGWRGIAGAAIITRDAVQFTVGDTLECEPSHADHLAVLGGIWDDLTCRAQHARYQQTLTDAPPEGLAEPVLADPACTWPWRTHGEAETVGLDPTRCFARPSPNAASPEPATSTPEASHSRPSDMSS
jgi:hypothetical protein